MYVSFLQTITHETYHDTRYHTQYTKHDIYNIDATRHATIHNTRDTKTLRASGRAICQRVGGGNKRTKEKNSASDKLWKTCNYITSYIKKNNASKKTSKLNIKLYI